MSIFQQSDSKCTKALLFGDTFSVFYFIIFISLFKGDFYLTFYNYKKPINIISKNTFILDATIDLCQGRFDKPSFNST